jgi:hypothetical protein
MVQGKSFRRSSGDTPKLTPLDILTATVIANRSAPFDYEVVLAVNGRPLQELIRGIDEPEAWVGPPFDVIKPPSRHLLGGDNEWCGDVSVPFPGDKVAVLSCSCGHPECGAIFTRITVRSDVVIWSDMECFKRPHADASWLSGFTFSCANYLATVEGIKAPTSVNSGAHLRHQPNLCPPEGRLAERSA